MQDQRLSLLQEWLTHVLAKQTFTILPITGDASFRRYFRVQLREQTYIAMDAPPDKEDCRPFVAIARAFAKLGVHVPQIFAAAIEQGFLLLSDFGDRLYVNELTADNVERLYANALLDLIKIQTCRKIPDWELPHFNRDFLLREWRLFLDWVIDKHCAVALTAREAHQLADSFALLADTAALQPQVCVHRDYHSRNLLYLAEDKVGILDFQDAVFGPITYDAVSLLRDCYIGWPREQIEKILDLFFERLHSETLLKKHSKEEFTYWFDLMGIQRNLKALGIFARLKHLYHRPHYLQYIPRGLNYVLQVSKNYRELTPLGFFLEQRVLPHFLEVENA